MASVKEAQLKISQQKTEELKGQMQQLEQDIEAAEKRTAEAEAVEDAMYEDFQRDLRQQLDAKMAHYSSPGATGSIDQIQSRLCQAHMDTTASMIKSKQNDVMRMNKVVREVSKGISTDWKPVFEYLMSAQLSKADIKKEVARIEKQNRPLMQAYKALNYWKDTKDEMMGLNQLADALRINKKVDLADYVYDVIDSQGDDYLKLKAPIGEEDGEGKPKRPAAGSTDNKGVLDDRKFLQLAKKIGSDWEQLATTLGLAEEDIQEIKESEGATYQGAFKMLWTWRDRTLELDQDNAEVLQEALKASGKGEVAELV